MIINLSKSVPLKEMCKITATGFTNKKPNLIEFVLSHEAIIGFATELLWTYSSIDDTKKEVIETYQLMVDGAPSQAIGFYLTPSSPILMVEVNSLMEIAEERVKHIKCKEINIKTKNIDVYYEIRDPSEEGMQLNTVEPYELSGKNVMNINIFNDRMEDITKDFTVVSFQINRRALKQFATMLLVWANNCKEGGRYMLPHVGKPDSGYNLGVILTYDSIPTRFKCQDLGSACEYDPSIG